MSNQDPCAIALRRAVTAGVPYVEASGPSVVLVLRVTRQLDGGGQISGEVVRWQCSSAAMARLVAARALNDLRMFPWYGAEILKVSEMYVRAARAHAARRQGVDPARLA
jgi:hypothetical protein